MKDPGQIRKPLTCTKPALPIRSWGWPGGGLTWASRFSPNSKSHHLGGTKGIAPRGASHHEQRTGGRSGAGTPCPGTPRLLSESRWPKPWQCWTKLLAALVKATGPVPVPHSKQASESHETDLLRVSVKAEPVAPPGLPLRQRTGRTGAGTRPPACRHHKGPRTRHCACTEAMETRPSVLGQWLGETDLPGWGEPFPAHNLDQNLGEDADEPTAPHVKFPRNVPGSIRHLHPRHQH